MSFSSNRGALLVVGALLVTSACGGNGAVPAASGANGPASQFSIAQTNAITPLDTTSILKKLTKNIVIGSTVDPTNGDTGPRAISVVGGDYVLKKGQLLVCNFDDSSGAAGKGTTIEVLNPTAGSKPTTFAQSTKIEGCDGDAISSGNNVYGAGFTSHVVEAFTPAGKTMKSYGAPIAEPLANDDAFNPRNMYAPEYDFVGDAKTGSIISFAVGQYGNHKEVQVITGFGVNKAAGWSALGPSGMQYNYKNDTLYVVDGVDDTVVAVSHASNLLVKDEIVVQPGGKTFKCKDKSATCASLVLSGSPLNAPEVSALLPNGNLVVANTAGGNKLVELTPTGQVLATKVLDKSKVAHIFGLQAIGSSDANTALFYTTTANNTLHELKQ